MTTAGKLAALHQQPAPLRNKIVTAICDAIETGLLPPGARLIERDLCEQLAVSRSSLREALRELEAEGVLTHADCRGLSVATISNEEAESAYSIRAMVEVLVLEQFIERASAAERAALVEIGGALKAAYRAGSVEEILSAKRAFYRLLCTAAHNSLAYDIISRLLLRTAGLRRHALARLDRPHESVSEIEAILSAVARRDASAAGAAATRHVANAAASGLRLLGQPAGARPVAVAC